MGRPVRLRIRLDGRRPRRWHAHLLDRIAALPELAGGEVEVDARPGTDPWPANVDLLFAFETLVKRLPRDGAAAALPRAALDRWPGPRAEAPDLILDLCGDVVATGDTRVWSLGYDGIAGEVGLLASLLDGRAPVMNLREGAIVRASGRFGTEMRGTVLASFEDGLTRTCTLVTAALAGRDESNLQIIEAVAGAIPPRLPLQTLGSRVARMLVRGVAQRLYHLCYQAPHWRTGWRHLDGPDLFDLRRHPATGWRDLPDDGGRFYADPFPIEHAGTTYLFVEEYVHALRKGIVSVVPFGREGPIGAPKPVLEVGHHLSYPFVFEREGQMWMVPESCGAGTIDLYRATAFPGGWVRESTLLAGIVASDATLIEHQGHWWMFATVRDGAVGAPLGHGSYSDSLHLWSAPGFRGPWTPHPQNPVLVDIASARPAGHVVVRGNGLVRPVQNCIEAYGGSLALARIDRLDESGFSQTVETAITSGPLWPGSLIHTVNRSGRIECIDGSGRSSRLGALINKPAPHD